MATIAHQKGVIVARAIPRNTNLLLHNSKPSKDTKTRIVMYTISACKFTIPARRSEPSPIENIFRIMEREFNQAVLKQVIMYENSDSFSAGIKGSLEALADGLVE